MRLACLFLLVAILAAACSTPERRIKKNQAVFDAAPPAVQALIRDGKADVGFTSEQVVMAMGKPDRVYSRATPSGSQEVWAYGGASPASRVGVGFGFGTISGRRHGSYTSTGVMIGAGDDPYYEDKARVVFEKGQVVSVERREK
jgi:hypothetical protein